MNHHHIFSILYLIVIRNVKREIQATFPLSLLNMIILRIFFPSAITEWNKLDCCISNADSFEDFKKRILSLLDQCQIVSTTSITLLELNISQD